MADTKTTNLTAFTPVLTDVLFGIDDPGGSPEAKKHTYAVLNTLLEANLVTPIIAAVANTEALAVTGYSLTGADATSMIDLAGTFNTSGTPTAIKMDITDTASNSASKLIDFQVGSVSKFNIEKGGRALLGSGDWDTNGLTDFYQSTIHANNKNIAAIRIRMNGNTAQLSLGSDGIFGFTSGSAAYLTRDVELYRDAASELALRVSTAAQKFSVYTTWTDASNYERLGITGSAVTVETAGTGTDNIDLTLAPAGTGTLVYGGGNAGTAGTGTTAVEHGDGFNMVTVLTMAGVLPAVTADPLAVGLLIYTFPAGVHRVKAIHMDVGINGAETNIDADTPDVGIGQTIATGAVSVLGGTAAFEDYVTGSAAANCTGTVTDLSEETTPSALTLNIASGTKTLHFNAADTWAGTDSAPALSGTVTIEWTFLGA